MMKRFSFVSLLHTGRWGASEYLWSQSAICLAQQGHRVSVNIHAWPSPVEELAPLRKAGVIFQERKPPRLSRCRDFINTLRHRSKLPLIHHHAASRVFQFRPDLVLLSSPWATNHLLTGWCERLHRNAIRYALLVHTHAGHNWPTGEFACKLADGFNRAEAVFCVSDDNRHLLERQLLLRPGLIRVVRNPLAIERHFKPSWPEDTVTRIACVGRLDPAQKGQDILLECLATPTWRDRNCSVGFFGDGPGRQQLEHLAKSLPRGAITFHGHTSNPSEIWRTHHLLVFPSRYEGLGLAVAEAQLCGRPVVISDCAARELVIDGETGFIATGTSASALGIALERAWRERESWAKLGEAARRHMLRTLPEDPVGDFATLLENL